MLWRVLEAQQLLGRQIGGVQAPAAVTAPIDDDNRGAKMLRAMGWCDGQGLGVRGQGITQPIAAVLAKGKRRGLGFKHAPLAKATRR